MVKTEKTVLTLSIKDWANSAIAFKNIASNYGYPNLSLNAMDIYQGLINVMNERTGDTVFQCCDGTMVEFGFKKDTVIFRSRDKVLFEYKEKVKKLAEVSYESKEHHFEDLPKYQPYDKLHRPSVGSVVLWDDGHYMITAVRTVPCSDLLYITVGDRTIRSDDFLNSCRYVDGSVCGWNEQSDLG